MFKHRKLLLAGAALLAAACSSSPMEDDGEFTSPDHGRLVMRIATPQQPSTGDYDPMRHLNVEVFNPRGEVIRRYENPQDRDIELKVIAGEYRIAARAGESGKTPQMSYADFEKRLYSGEQTFKVEPQKTTRVELRCKSVNTCAEVKFDDSVIGKFEQGFSVTVAADTEYSQERIDRQQVAALRYTRNAAGYFDLREEDRTLVWKFTGRHSTDGEVERTGKIEQVEQPGRYTLTFKYSPSAPGFVECFLIKVDTTSPEFDDTIIFDPGLTIVGSGFDLTDCQEYRGEDKTFTISGKKEISMLQLDVAGQQTDLLAEGQPEGVKVTRESSSKIIVTLSKPYFDRLGAGNHRLSFSAADTGGGTLSSPVMFRLRGFIRPTTEDCDLWNNTLTLRYVEFDSETTPVTFGLREQGATEWQTLVGVKGDDGIYTATFTPQWEQAQNGGGLTTYRPKAATGIFANHTYECYGKSEEEGIIALAPTCDQPLPFHDMESPISAFTKDNANSTAWASGNNGFTPSLCTQAQFGGSNCAKLASSFLMVMASGNLFTGTFRAQGTGGSASFGQDYTWQARPKSLKVRYHANIGTVNCVKHKKDGKDPIANGQPDKARIFVAIVDWERRHEVASSIKEVRGAWDPEESSSQPEGRIIGYGSHYISGVSQGEEMTALEIPIHYYDTQARPSKSIKLVISCTASAYGDYMNGCDKNVMYVDDFEWGY